MDRKNAIIANMMDVFNIMVQCSPHVGAGVETTQGMIRYFSGSSFPLFNGVFSDSAVITNPQQHFHQTVEFFSAKQVPFAWFWLAQTAVPLEIQQYLEDFAFNPLGVYSGIAVKLEDIILKATDKKISVKEVANVEQYENFIDIICQVFGFTPEVKQDYLAMMKLYGPEGVFKHYLGYYEDEPVATLTSYVKAGVVGLYNGATLPQWQKHGLCTALIQQAVQAAKQRDCKLAIAQLMAPGMAKGLTKKLGFNTYCELLPYVKCSADFMQERQQPQQQVREELFP